MCRYGNMFKMPYGIYTTRLHFKECMYVLMNIYKKGLTIAIASKIKIGDWRTIRFNFEFLLQNYIFNDYIVLRLQLHVLPWENSKVILSNEKSKSKNDVYNMMPYGLLKTIS